MSFWSDQVVITTGGAGFLGQHVVNHLHELGAKKVVVPRSFGYDLRTPYGCEWLFRDHPNATMVIHMAATVGGIGANRQHPGLFYYDNILMNTYVMEYARLAGVQKFVGLGSVCGYPVEPPIPFREEDLWNGYPEPTNAAYGLVKRMLLVQGQAYRQEYGFNAIHLMPTNLYGPGDHDDPETSHVIPALIRKFQEAKATGQDVVTLWGSGKASRDFLYALDAAKGICMAAEHYDGSEPVNLGSGKETSIQKLSTDIADLIDPQRTIAIRWDTSKPNGQPRRVLDSSMAYDLFGWKAETSLEDGLRETIHSMAIV